MMDGINVGDWVYAKARLEKNVTRLLVGCVIGTGSLGLCVRMIGIDSYGHELPHTTCVPWESVEIVDLFTSEEAVKHYYEDMQKVLLMRLEGLRGQPL